MSSFFDKLGRIFIPPAIRPYLTFRSVTILVVVLYALAFLLKSVVKVPIERLPGLRAEEQIFYSRTFLVIYNAALALGFAAVYATRNRQHVYFRRVVIYGMLLAAVLGELMDIFVPWRV